MSVTRRLFFALSLPETLQQAVVQWRAEQFPRQAGYPIAAANLHLTLAFLDEVSEQKERALRTQAARIRQAPFHLHLNDAGHWPGPGVVWLGCRQAPRGLYNWRHYCVPRPRAVAVTKARNRFTHTLLCYAVRLAQSPCPLRPSNGHWKSQQFALYQSTQEQGKTRYQTLANWPLSL